MQSWTPDWADFLLDELDLDPAAADRLRRARSPLDVLKSLNEEAGRQATILRIASDQDSEFEHVREAIPEGAVWVCAADALRPVPAKFADASYLVVRPAPNFKGFKVRCDSNANVTVKVDTEKFFRLKRPDAALLAVLFAPTKKGNRP